MEGSVEESAIGAFANACDLMNDFARELRSFDLFKEVTTGADIRDYESGWRLEKWIEARLASEDCVAAWWLELGRSEDRWILQSHVAISPDIFFQGFEDRRADSVSQLKNCLLDAVRELREVMGAGGSFRQRGNEEGSSITRTGEKANIKRPARAF